MAEKTNIPDLPVIEKKQKNGKSYVHWLGKEFGPWDRLDEKVQFSPDGKHWAIRGELHDKYYVLTDDCKYGPFDGHVVGPEFDEERGVFVFAAMRGSEFLLVTGGKVVRQGRIVERPGEGKYILVGKSRYGPYYEVWSAHFSLQGGRWAAIASRDGQGKGFYLVLDGKESGPFTELEPRGEFSPGGHIFFCRELFGDDTRTQQNIVINGERVYGPCEASFIHFFSPDGRRWMVHAKREGFEGIVVDGREYGNYPFPKFIFDFSPDSRHWYALIGKGEKDMIVIDGREYGTYELKAPHFTVESRFVAYFRKRKADWIFYDGREVGPFRYKNKRRIHLEDAVLADMIFIKKGTKTVRRCVITCTVDGSGKRILFSPRTGETLKDAIEIINAADTNEGVTAEYSYLRLKFQSLSKEFNVVRQELFPRSGRHYDILTVEFAGGKQENYYFDITEFFGKFTGGLAKYSTKKEAETE